MKPRKSLRELSWLAWGLAVTQSQEQKQRFSPIAAFSSYSGFVQRDLCWGVGPQEYKIFY